MSVSKKLFNSNKIIGVYIEKYHLILSSFTKITYFFKRKKVYLNDR